MTRVPMGSSVTRGRGDAVRAADAGPLRRGACPTRASARSSSPSGGGCPAPSWTSSRSARTSRPRPRPTRAGSTSSSPRCRCPAAAWSGPTRACAAARPSRRWPGCATAFRPDGVMTAGNSSQISDGAAALLMTTSGTRAALGLAPLARVHSVALAGGDPVIMLTAPIPATREGAGPGRPDARRDRRVRGQRGVRVGAAAWLAETGADPKRLNPNGGAIALGHPLGGSGARLMTTLVHHMRRQRDPLRAADHVRGRRAGQRDHPRTALGIPLVQAAH